MGKGAVLTLYLPAVADTVLRPYSKSAKMVSGPGRILVMDDDELIRQALSQLLVKMGFETDAVPDGESAAAMFREATAAGRPYVAVILDNTIPGGVETLEQLREIDPDILAVVSSGYANAPVMAQNEKYGFQAGLAKPFTAEELSEVLHDLLGDQ